LSRLEGIIKTIRIEGKDLKGFEISICPLEGKDTVVK